jgi:hypothetical protein
VEGATKSTTGAEAAAAANAEAIEAWDGPLYDRFVRFREIVTTGLAVHGEEALRLFPPQPGAPGARPRLRVRRHDAADR